MSQFEKIATYISQLAHDYHGRDEAVQLHNEYCDGTNDNDNIIYDMSSFEDVISCIDRMELVNMVAYGEFNPHHDYFTFNGSGNLESTDFPADWIYPSDIAAYCVRNDADLGNKEIRALLDEEVSE